MPALITNYQKKVTATRLAKFFSMFSQAEQSSIAENGDKAGWEFPTNAWNGPQAKAYFEKYYLPYLKYVKYCATDINKGCGSVYDSHPAVVKMILADGMTLELTGSSGTFYMYLDINGFQKPNKIGVDQFNFQSNYSNNPMKPSTWIQSISLEPKTREEFLSGCKTDPSICASLIRYDGWEIKDDYPW
jgi:hypothetical protein